MKECVFNNKASETKTMILGDKISLQLNYT